MYKVERTCIFILLQVIEDDELPSDCSQNYAGTLYVNLRYDLTRYNIQVYLEGPCCQQDFYYCCVKSKLN